MTTFYENFDEDMFDLGVARSITNIHRKSALNEKNRNFKKWANENLNYLDDMYDLSGLDCDFESFICYVFMDS